MKCKTDRFPIAVHIFWILKLAIIIITTIIVYLLLLLFLFLLLLLVLLLLLLNIQYHLRSTVYILVIFISSEDTKSEAT